MHATTLVVFQRETKVKIDHVSTRNNDLAGGKRLSLTVTDTSTWFSALDVYIDCPPIPIDLLLPSVWEVGSIHCRVVPLGLASLTIHVKYAAFRCHFTHPAA